MSQPKSLSKADLPTLGYGAMHARACLLALRQGARRWGVYVLMAAVLAGAGADLASALAALQAMAAWLVLPLFWAVVQGPAWALAGLVLHALAGAGLLLGARQGLWPAHWAEQERALPIAPSDQSRSDLRLMALALLPWCGLCAGGAFVWLLRRPAWLAGHEALATLALLAALLGTMALGGLMQRLRRRPPSAGRLDGAAPGAAPGRAYHSLADLRDKAALRSRSRSRSRSLVAWLHVLVVWPLWREVAPRSLRALLLAFVVVVALAAAAAWAPQWAPWWLAAQSLAALVAVSRLKLLTALELGPLQEACTPLPLPAPRLQAARQVLAALPLLLGAAAMVLAVALAVPSGQLRTGRVLAWALCLAIAAGMELCWVQPDAGVRAARWIFMWILSVALGSEVWR